MVLYSSILIFTIGSLLCGFAPVSNFCHLINVLELIYQKNYISLCVFRAVAGTGGGGIVSAVWLITAESVSVDRRASWSQALSVTWSASAVAGGWLFVLKCVTNSIRVLTTQVPYSGVCLAVSLLCFCIP